MPNLTPVRYRDATGVWHEVTVHRTADGTYEVIDAAGSDRELIDTLAGYGDGIEQAEAVARDYAAHRHSPDAG